MKNLRKIIGYVVLMFAIWVTTVSCMKDFLDMKRDKSQVIPVNLADYQALLDHNPLNNFYSVLLGEIGSDDYYIENDQWQLLTNPVQKNAYVWADDVYQGGNGDDWNRGYEKILLANFVLEGVLNIGETEMNRRSRNELLGAAYFHRGASMYFLAQLFCKQYEESNATESLGLPLRLKSNINNTYPRSTLKETYQQIAEDLKLAAYLLPREVEVNTRPSKLAAWGMLSNLYLQIQRYTEARNYADSLLAVRSVLIDYNTIDTSIATPFPQYGQGNREIIFFAQMSNAAILSNSRLIIDSTLYDLYENSDLRKRLFFVNRGDKPTFKGHYSGLPSFMFCGLTTAEALLIRAECSVRLGNVNDALSDLNYLLVNRYMKETFVPHMDDRSSEEVLSVVLLERRKELIFRGRRWHDLKRMAIDADLAHPLIRRLGDSAFVLPVGSPKWVWPIPENAITLGGYIQNDY